MPKTRLFNVFQYCDPTDDIPFYVSYDKPGREARRWYSLKLHIREPDLFNEVDSKLWSLRKKRLTPFIEILDRNLTEKQANKLTYQIIDDYKYDNIICNGPMSDYKQREKPVGLGWEVICIIDPRDNNPFYISYRKINNRRERSLHTSLHEKTPYMKRLKELEQSKLEPIILVEQSNIASREEAQQIVHQVIKKYGSKLDTVEINGTNRQGTLLNNIYFGLGVNWPLLRQKLK